MHIVLLILKIAGLVLISLLAFALLIILLVLFVPVNYTVSGVFDIEEGKYENTDNVRVVFKAGWLLRLFYVRYDYAGESLGVIRVFGIPIKRIRNEEEEETEEEEISVPKPYLSPKMVSREEKDTKDEKKAEKKAENKAENKAEKPAKQKKKTSNKLEKIKSGFGKLKDNRGFIKAVKDTIVKILKHIRPNKIRADMIIGLEDPAMTGLLFGGLGLLMTIWPGKYKICPDFEKKIVRGNVSLKGRIRIFNIALYLFQAIRNEEIKKVIRRKGDR